MIRRPLSTVLAPRRTRKISTPAITQSEQRRLAPLRSETVLFLLFCDVVRRVASHRGAPPAPPGQPEHIGMSGGVHCIVGDRSKEDDGSSKRHRVIFTSPTTVACSPLLTAPNPCTPLERGRKRLAQPMAIHRACQCLVRHVSRLQVDGRAARRSRQASEKKRRGQQSTLSSSPQAAN